MKFELKPNNRNPNKNDVLNDIKSIADKLGKTTLTASEYNKFGRWHSDTPIRLFEKWNKALSLAGLEVAKRINVPDEELFINLQELWIKLGRQPYISDVLKPFSKVDSSVYKRRFKSWRSALELFIKYVNENKTDVENQNINKPENALEIITRSRTVGWRTRFLLMQRDNFKRRICGKSPSNGDQVKLVIDHIHPYSKGGVTEFDNLQTLCMVCNGGKSDLM
jgi:hypothetical protein